MIPNSIENDVGLTSADVAERIAKGLVNRTPAEGWRPYLEIAFRNVMTLFNALVVPAAAALFLLGDYRGAWAVSGVAMANVAIGLAHELRVKRHLDSLSLLGESHVRVKRDGSAVSISSSEVVLDEHILLSAGETIVADGVVTGESYLEVDESLLTGESDPIRKKTGDAIQSGSVCVAGEGIYIAQRIGKDAFAHKTAAAARKYQQSLGPTQKTLQKLVQWLTIIAVTLCVSYVGLYFSRGLSKTELVQMVAATITSMVPQGLVLLTTLTFVLAATRLSRIGAVVQRLNAVEGLAGVNVLCTDKTGTLTTGHLTLDHVECFNESESAIKSWLGLFAAVSVDRKNKTIEAIRKAVPANADGIQVLDQLPFQSQNRFSEVLIQLNGGNRLFVLGSFEKLRSSFPAGTFSIIETSWQKLLSSGNRLVAFADATFDATTLNNRLPAVPLRLLALIVLKDELRDGVAGTLEAFANRGIELKVISGDHPETIQALLHNLGPQFSNQKLFTGDEWAASSNRNTLADQCRVFGRVAPDQKLALVEALQMNGRNVGMIGDGVNDILPIKKANFGVAMGAGSPATQAVADVILESNDFGVLPEVLAEGQRVLQNVRRAAKLFLLKNIYTIALILIAVGIFGLPFPYLPQQVTLLNALTIGGPAILILARRTSSAKAQSAGFFADVNSFLLSAGIAMSISGLSIYLGSALICHHDHEVARTMLLMTLILSGLGYAVVASHGERPLIAWAGMAIVAVILVNVIAPIAYFFALSPLSINQWLVIILAAGGALLPAVWLSRNGSHASENQFVTADDPKRDG